MKHIVYRPLLIAIFGCWSWVSLAQPAGYAPLKEDPKSIAAGPAIRFATNFPSGYQYSQLSSKQNGFELNTILGQNQKTGISIAVSALEYGQNKMGKDQMRYYVLQETGIAADKWKPMTEGQNENGMSWYETYGAFLKKKKYMLMFTGRNRWHTINYMVWVHGPQEAFTSSNPDISAFIDGIEGLK